MAQGQARGLVFFIMIAVLAGLGGVGIWQLRGRSGPNAGPADEEGGDGHRLVKGTGTSWREEEAATDPSGAIEGLVRDADGAPVDGVTVTLGRAVARGEDAPSMSHWLPRGTATTAGGGRFRIEKLVPGEYSATAAREGMGPGQRGSIEVLARQTAHVEIKLARVGLALSGRVLDVGGGAIAGARVTAVGQSGGMGRAAALFGAVSGAEGQYRLTLARGPVALRVEAEGYAPLLDTDLLLVRPTTRDLRLVPGARLSGRVVVRDSRQPLAEAEVSLTSAVRTDFREARDTRTDGDGRFELTALEPGNYEVMARKGVLVGAGKTVALAVAQSVGDVEVEVDRAHVVSGRVKDDAGASLGSIRVSAYRDSPPFGQAARTRSNPDGSYALEGLLPGSYRIDASEDGFGFSSARANVVTADLASVDVTLTRVVKVTGKVVTAEGRPVEGARVRATLEGRQGGGGSFSAGDSATTAADGTFELKRISPGSLRLTAQAEQQGSASVGPEEIKAGQPKVLSLKLGKGSALSGTVRTEDGRPAPDVRVTVRIRTGAMSLSSEQDVSGPDGRYRIENVPAGQVIVTASRSSRGGFDMSPRAERADQKTLALGEAEDKTGIDLVVAPPGTALAGTVVGPDGKPVAGAVLTAGVERDGRAFRGSSRDLRTYSQIDGQFTLEEVGKVPHTIWASHPDHPDTEVKGVMGGATGVKVTFPPDTSVAGLVVGPDGKPIANYTIAILPGPRANETPEDRRRRQSAGFDARTQRVQSPAGTFEILRLAPGAHELHATGPAGESASQVVTLAAGERRTGLRIPLAPGLRVTGRVIEHGSGKPVPEATVYAMGRGAARPQAEVKPDGSFVLEGAPVGDSLRLSFQAEFTRYVAESKEVEIKPGQTIVDAGTVRLLPGDMRQRLGVDRADRGESGANLAVEGGRPVVRSLRPDSAAARAGLKKGDLVTAINGTGVGELGNGALRFLGSGRPGASVSFVVETPGGGPARTVNVTLEPFAPPPARSN